MYRPPTILSLSFSSSRLRNQIMSDTASRKTYEGSDVNYSFIVTRASKWGSGTPAPWYDSRRHYAWIEVVSEGTT